ncbi:MAG: thioredoxin [Lachnospiraceae bacterium]|nr:thioredoxin [Lachnospiraceae bacterium]
MEVKLTNGNFKAEVLKSDKPVLVDFYADWCGPCQMVGPILEELAKEREDIKIGKINVDEEGELALKYKVSSIPYLAYFKNGEIVNQMVGFQGKEKILDMLK